MKRRDFLGLTLGLAAGAAVFVGSAQAAPLPPVAAGAAPVTAGANAEPAVVSQNEVDHLKPQQVHWHHHGGWHHHHWHHRHWHHRHWHRHWHHHRHW